MLRSILFLLFFYCALSFDSSSQTEMSPREAFFYTMRVNQISPYDQLSYSGLINSGKTFQWVDFYASYFDPSNYLRSVNDEFKRKPYLTAIQDEMMKGINSVNLNKIFYLWGNVTLGTWDDNCSCFPVISRGISNADLLNIKKIGNNELAFNNAFVSSSIERYFNYDDFDFFLRMKPSAAEHFVDSRKDSRGQVNRAVSIKVYYNVVNRSFEPKNKEYFIGIYVHKMELYDGAALLGTLLPAINYEDKVNLIKRRNGRDTVYFDNNWNALNRQALARMTVYRVLNYQNGNATGPVTDYYPSGKKRMDGTVTNGTFDGHFTWYYEDGAKWAEGDYANGNLNGSYTAWHTNGKVFKKVNYNNGKENGLYTEWYSNGQMKEQVNYLNGAMDGCDYTWDENGNCKSGSHEWGNSADYYENGTVKMSASKCPCKTAATGDFETTKNTNEPRSFVPTDYSGYYNNQYSDGDYQFNNGFYYKTNSVKIRSVNFDVNGSSPGYENGGLVFRGTEEKNQVLNTTIFFEGLTMGNNGLYKYSVSLCNMYGNEVFDKKENMLMSGRNNLLSLKIPYNAPSLRPGARNSHTFYMNILIQDKNSQTKLQGFFKFTITP